MELLGHGIDIVDVSDMSRLIDANNHFLNRCFTADEVADVGEGVTRCERLAGRFAAKESIAKALAVGWGDGLAWTDIEVRTSDLGAPYVVLHGAAIGIAKGKGISDFLLSISHCSVFAVASAIAIA